MEKAYVTLQEPRRQFVPEKRICERDFIIVDMLNSPGHEDVPFCVCDPALADCPIIYASPGFCAFTLYHHKEIEGRNCRFLQGPETDRKDVEKIKKAIVEETEQSVNLLNYRKDGTKFVNEFFLSPLRDNNDQVLYFMGVQTEVPQMGPGQMPANPGWVYTQGSHV
mmetsp:Transcript_38724/g.116330  ORF Transcript_38724/g.116330 Transcript_38724/m.116330 type:complete len:166 (-) Transcript_38724:639-1136(-)